MNSFRELIEIPVVTITEEAIRFRGIDWLITHDDKSGCEPCFCFRLRGFIPLFAEIGGKKFLHHEDHQQQHIGFYWHAKQDGFIPLLARIGGQEWIDHVNRHGQPMDFGRKLDISGSR